jgi:hypothetical protein
LWRQVPGTYDGLTFTVAQSQKLIVDTLQIHARLGEVLYISATSGNDSVDDKTLAEAMRRFCRSIELCDDYLRGYYGLKLVRKDTP